MDAEIAAKLDALERKIDAVYVSAEKTRKYFMWTGIITIAVIILPLFALPFVIGQFLTSLGDMSSLLQ